ncbi:hypothetical protein NFI96_016769 [Prochilodus magdalenae]|nr:hypothetical protein NFI96_016769 [Prochilodus magdalenae]
MHAPLFVVVFSQLIGVAVSARDIGASGRRTGRLYCRVGIGFHLQIHPNGRVNGSHEPDHLSVLELFAVSQGVIGIRGVFSNRFLAMNKRGWLHATERFTDDCKFRERFQENSYNTYASVTHKNHRTDQMHLNTSRCKKCACSLNVHVTRCYGNHTACGNSMEENNSAAALDNTVAEFQSYEDFLESHITALDLYYLEDKELARQLVELGYKGSGEVMKREQFETRKAAAEASRLSNRTQQKTLASAGKELKDNFLRALAEREEANRSGKMNSILFIRDHNSHGQEISGYIDYSHRLQSEDFEPYFSGKKKLLPGSTDLSFYNWKTQACASSDSANYQVIADSPTGLLFANTKDRKILNVDPKASPGDNSSRTALHSDLYIHVVIYDHITRRNV